MPTDYIRYDLLVQDALRSVVRKVMTEAARSGLPGEHHFNIAFKTQAPGRRHSAGDAPAISRRNGDHPAARILGSGGDRRRVRGQPELLAQAGAAHHSLRRHHRFQRPFRALRLQAGAAARGRTRASEADAGRARSGEERRGPVRRARRRRQSRPNPRRRRNPSKVRPRSRKSRRTARPRRSSPSTRSARNSRG